VLVDLGSTNGTRVNGVRITERELRDGDELLFGNTRLVFEAS
jgi:pSer/pThr/pTyr-binding forkhead associated (FHA) protein